MLTLFSESYQSIFGVYLPCNMPAIFIHWDVSWRCDSGNRTPGEDVRHHDHCQLRCTISFTGNHLVYLMTEYWFQSRILTVLQSLTMPSSVSPLNKDVTLNNEVFCERERERDREMERQMGESICCESLIVEIKGHYQGRWKWNNKFKNRTKMLVR